MVSIIKRMRRLKTLLAIRLGPGAAILPNNVERIHLHFATKIDDGHRGPRKFWRHMLPRLKYHNPAIPMTVSRNDDQIGPARLLLYLRKPGATAADALEEVEPEVAEQTDQKAELLPSETFPTDPAPLRKITREPLKTVIPRARKSQTLVEINCKNKQEDDIWREFVAATDATEISPTQGELDDLRELEEFREKSQRDSARSKAVRAAWKREQEMLKEARGAM